MYDGRSVSACSLNCYGITEVFKRGAEIDSEATHTSRLALLIQACSGISKYGCQTG